jgi:DNA-binding transcriptional ArsR family regulator
MNKLEFDNITTNGVLDNPIRLKLYLYLRSINQPIGIRETQRALNINSASTVSWHLEKLLEAGYIKKNTDNRYQLRADHILGEKIVISIDFTAFLFNKSLISPTTFLIAFLMAMFIFSLWIWIGLRDPFFIGLQGFFSLIISILSIFYIHLKIKTKIDLMKS